MVNYLLSLDPGYKQSGIALFEEGRLIYAALIEITEPDRNIVKHWQDQRRMMEEILAYRIPRHRSIVSVSVAAEIMQVDQRTKKAQMKELLRLQGTSALSEALVMGGGEFDGYPPSTWNNNRAKGPNHSRILRRLDDREKENLVTKANKITNGKSKKLFASLRPKIGDPATLYDRAVNEDVGQSEHVLDAIGIGLYCLGRL